MSTSLCLLTYIGDYTRQSTCRSFRAHYVLRVDTVPKRNEYQKYYLGGKGGRCVRLTTLPPSCADFLEIWEPQPPGTLGAFQGCSGKSLHLPNAHNQVCSDMTNSDVQAEVRAFAKTDCPKFTKIITSSVYDCTVEDVEYIYNKLSIHIFNSKRRLSVL